MLRNPKRMNRVTYRSKCYAALAVVIGPGRNRLRSVVLVVQAIDIVGFGQNILRILVIIDKMLLVVDDEILDTRGDGMVVVLDVNLKRRQRWVTHVSSAHHVTIVL